MEIMRLYEIFEEDTSNLLAMARWAMEEHPDEVKEYLGITHCLGHACVDWKW